MPKSKEQLQEEFRNNENQFQAGSRLITDWFTVGVTVKDPLDHDKPVTFTNRTDAKDFLARLNNSTDPEFPLSESGRTIDQLFGHFKYFLFSKGVPPQDFMKAIMHPAGQPETEDIKKLKRTIEDVRQEFFDMIINRDVKKIGKMYADAFGNLQNLNMEWLRQANTPEKLNDVYPMLFTLAGAQSFYIQTNNQGTEMRPIDREVMKRVAAETEKAGIDLEKLSGPLMYLETDYLYARKDALKLTADGSSLLRLNNLAMLHGTIPENARLFEIGTVGYSKEIQLRVAVDSAGIKLDEDDIYAEANPDYGNNLTAWVNGDENALPPYQLLEETVPRKVADRVRWQKTSGDGIRPNYDFRPENWKADMEERFRSNDLMDAASVLHCINLAKNKNLPKKKTYDYIAGKKGEGDRLLAVINGDHAEFDKLTDLSKAAAVGYLVTKHPKLFVNSVQEMRKAADALGMDLGNPVYEAALDVAANLSNPSAGQRISELKEQLAAKKADAAIINASPDAKKDMVKNLFLMQLGIAEAEGQANGKDKEVRMLDMLASGGAVRFVLPQMTRQEKDDLSRRIPKGKQELSNGVSREISYGKDNTLSIQMNGVRSRTAAGGAEVDLRGISPKNLNSMMAALDEKLNTMTEAGVNNLIRQLEKRSMDRRTLAVLVQGFGFGTQYENQLKEAKEEISPANTLDQKDFNVIDRIYSRELDGNRKYTAPEKLDTKKFEDTLMADPVQDHKDYFGKHLQFYLEQVNQAKLYADAAERMYRVRMENENSDEPRANVRVFAQKKEMELAEKYRKAKANVERLEAGIKEFSLVENPEKDPEFKLDKVDEKRTSTAWVQCFLNDRSTARFVLDNAGKGVVSKEALEAGLASEFQAIDMEEATFREQKNLADSKWKFWGVTYSNSNTYKDIIDSMDTLKKMREMEATEDNIKAYQKEYEFLQDLCAHYLVSRKNPWSDDGKARRKMVTDIWEGMSNVNSLSFEQAKKSANPGQKLGSLDFHLGDRRKVSLQELETDERARKARISKVRAEKKSLKVQQQAEEAHNAMAQDLANHQGQGDVHAQRRPARRNH